MIANENVQGMQLTTMNKGFIESTFGCKIPSNFLLSKNYMVSWAKALDKTPFPVFASISENFITIKFYIFIFKAEKIHSD